MVIEAGRIEKLAQEDDAVLVMDEWPGPLALFKKALNRYQTPGELQQALELCSSIVVRYGRRLPPGKKSMDVTCRLGGTRQVISAGPLEGDEMLSWVMQ